MEDLLGCLLEPLFEWLLLPHFSARTASSWLRLFIAVGIDGGVAAFGAWVLFQAQSSHAWPMVFVGAAFCVGFAWMLVITLIRFYHAEKGAH